jgi:hypothetical protein
MSRTPGLGFLNRLNLTHKVSIAALGAVGATSLAFAVVPAGSASGTGASVTSAASAPAAWTTGAQTSAGHASITDKPTHAARIVDAAFDKAASRAVSQQAATAHATAKAATKAKAEAARRAAAKHNAERHSHLHVKAASASTSAIRTAQGDSLNGWIDQALSVMREHGIPGSYSGIYRNVMRESSGNPEAINNWDINAQNGVPSKGLLQVIPPTFSTYHVSGTSEDIYDPVANIVAACNYAAAKYGSMDNVNSAY